MAQNAGVDVTLPTAGRTAGLQAGLEIAMFLSIQEEEIKLQLLYTKHTKQYTTRLLTKS